MIRPRWQKVIADLWGNRTRSLLVVASIAVGLFALGVMATIYSVSLDDMQRGYAATNPSNITIQSTLFSQGLVDHLATLDGVKQAEGVRFFSTRLETTPQKWSAIEIQALRNPGEQPVNQVSLVEGVWPPGDGEIVVDQHKLENVSAAIGDQITLELPSGKTRQLKLVGIVKDPTIGAFFSMGGFFGAPVQGYINQHTLESLEQPLPKRYNRLYVTVDGDSTDADYLESIATELRDTLEKNDINMSSSVLRSSFDHPNHFLAQAVLSVLLVIGLLAIFLSGFLITNTLQAIMNQQVQQIGILKSVGARRSQIVGIYLMLNLIYGLLALAIALPLSFVVAYWIIDFLTVMMNTTFYGFRIVPEVVLVEAALAILMPQIAAVFPIRQGTKISVQEALSGIQQNHPPNQGWLDRRISRLRNVSLLVVISLRNTFRRKGRLLLTIITLSLGGAIFIATFNVRVSLLDYVGQIFQYFLADVNITLDRTYRIEALAPLMEEVPGVKGVEGWGFARTELMKTDGSVGESVSLLAPPAASPLVKPIMVEGRWIKPGDQNAIALSELFRERYPGLKVGDTIRLRVNGDETDWVVVGFYQLAGKITGFAAYTSYEYLTELTHQEGSSASYRVVSDRADLTQEEQLALGRAIEAHLKSYGITVADLTTGQSMSQTAKDGFNVITALLLFLSVLTALVGSIGLTGAMSLNVMERTREVGVLRAVGASDRMLMITVLLEGGMIGLISWLLASLMAFPISAAMSNAISQSLFGGSTNFGFTPIGFVLWLVVVVILSVVASVMPARSVTHLTIREVLAYE